MIVIALGANLPGRGGTSPLASCQAAVTSIRGIPGLRIAKLSRWYVTAPVPASDQPDYVNGAALLEGTADPVALLVRLQEIESQAGRVRGEANAARVLDLDIVAIDDMVREETDPLLPHPRMHERAFVLRPMADVAPMWVHPRLGRNVAQMLAMLPAQDIRAL